MKRAHDGGHRTRVIKHGSGARLDGPGLHEGQRERQKTRD